jgi:hypothetical protein
MTTSAAYLRVPRRDVSVLKVLFANPPLTIVQSDRLPATNGGRGQLAVVPELSVHQGARARLVRPRSRPPPALVASAGLSAPVVTARRKSAYGGGRYRAVMER